MQYSIVQSVQAGWLQNCFHQHFSKVSKEYFGSFCMDGLAMALFSFYHTTTFMAALAKCVNMLGDADSTGAIVGQLAGAFYGIDGIDKRLLGRLRQWDHGESGIS